MKASFLLPAALLLVGCRSSNQLLPLAVGKEWTFRYRWGVQREPGALKVVREVPVADGPGYELTGPMGTCRLGYQGNTLVADQLGDSFMVPPLPIGIPAGKRAIWSGWITTPRGKFPAKATLAASLDELPVGGRPRKLNHSLTRIRMGTHQIELTTWYAPGDGIIQQEQVTDGTPDLSIVRAIG